MRATTTGDAAGEDDGGAGLMGLPGDLDHRKWMQQDEMRMNGWIPLRLCFPPGFLWKHSLLGMIGFPGDLLCGARVRIIFGVCFELDVSEGSSGGMRDEGMRRMRKEKRRG
jgi:hypothetical protein